MDLQTEDVAARFNDVDLTDVYGDDLKVLSCGSPGEVGSDATLGHEERSRSQTLFKLACAGKRLLIVLAVQICLLALPRTLYSVKKVSCALYIGSKSVLLTQQPKEAKAPREKAITNASAPAAAKVPRRA